MGKRGPAKAPTKVLEARGSWHVRERKGEPTPEAGRPRAPKWLSREARKHWDEITPKIDDMGVLTKIDRDALALYCDYWTRWVKCSEFLRDNNLHQSVETRHGTEAKQWPESRESLQLASHILRYQQQFGLTPSARAGLVVNKEEHVKKKKETPGKSRFFEFTKTS